MTLISVTTANSTTILAAFGEFHAISSPYYPRSYPNNVDIRFTIHSLQGRNVKLIVLDLSIDRICGLDADSLTISESKL